MIKQQKISSQLQMKLKYAYQKFKKKSKNYIMMIESPMGRK